MTIENLSLLDKIKSGTSVFSDNIKETISSRKFQFIVVVLIVLFSLASVYVYRTYIKKKLNKSFVDNKEFIGDKPYVEGTQIYYFYTEWCPHCKKATPIWNEFKDLAIFKNDEYKGVPIKFISVNCDKEQKLADKFDVKGYPTIKLVRGNKVIEYDAKPNLDSLKQFIDTSI